MNFCRQCGKEHRKGANFCVKCGMPVAKNTMQYTEQQQEPYYVGSFEPPPDAQLALSETEAKPIDELSKWLSIPEHAYNTEYKTHVLQYTKKQGVFALLSCFFYLYFIVARRILIYILYIIDFPYVVEHGAQTLIFNGLMAAIMLAGCFVILLINKAKLKSVGIGMLNIKQALRLGAILGIATILGAIIFGNMENADVRFLSITVIFITITFAFLEDVFFIGFLQTRLHGLIKHERLAILIGSLVFGLFHFGHLAANPFLIVFFVIMHISLNAIYRRYLSIVPVTIIHTIHNIMNNMGLGLVSFSLVITVYLWVIFLRAGEHENL